MRLNTSTASQGASLTQGESRPARESKLKARNLRSCCANSWRCHPPHLVSMVKVTDGDPGEKDSTLHCSLPQLREGDLPPRDTQARQDADVSSPPVSNRGQCWSLWTRVAELAPSTGCCSILCAHDAELAAASEGAVPLHLLRAHNLLLHAAGHCEPWGSSSNYNRTCSKEHQVPSNSVTAESPAELRSTRPTAD